MDWILLSKHSISALAQFVLSVLITGYLLTTPRKTTPTWLLIGFFSTFSAALLCAFLLGATQPVMYPVLGGGRFVLVGVYVVLIIQFAYWFPANGHRQESKIALWVSITTVVGVMWLGATNLMTELERALLILSLGVVALVVWTIIVFLRKSKNYALGTKDTALLMPWHSGAWNSPAHRSFAGLMGLLLVLSLSSALDGVGIISLQTLITVVAALYMRPLIASVFVYINNTPVRLRL